MTKDKLKEKITELERAAGVVEDGAKFFIKISPDETGGKYHAYCYSEDETGKKTFYKNGLPLTDKELQNIETNCTIILDDI